MRNWMFFINSFVITTRTPGGFFYMEDEEFIDMLEGILAKLNRYE